MARLLQDIVHHLGRAVAGDGLSRLTDAELLLRFAAERDADAFEVLVRRHGAMVLGVCGRVVGPGPDADDAFQATFLALVRHARSLRGGDALGGWLYRVARRVSVRAARQNARRARRERAAARPEAVAADDPERADWRALLDREVERLPAHYREAFILCHLEGREHEAAARELGCPLGTLHSRLARAKERLRARLGEGGVSLGGAGVVTLSARQVNAAVSAALGSVEGSAGATSAAAVVLSQGVWKPMTPSTVKFLVAAVLAAVSIGSGVVLLERPAAIATPTAPPRGEPTIDELKRENERLRREVAGLRKRLAELDPSTAPRPDDAPTDAEVLRALPRAAGGGAALTRDEVTIVKTKMLDRLDPPRWFPLVGMAQLRHTHWECRVYFIETVAQELPLPTLVRKPRVEVVYLDKDVLVRVDGRAK